MTNHIDLEENCFHLVGLVDLVGLDCLDVFSSLLEVLGRRSDFVCGPGGILRMIKNPKN